MSILFYNKLTGNAAIGQFDNENFTTTKIFNEGSFGSWTHIVKCPSSDVLEQKSRLFFYDIDTGAGASGSLTATDFVTEKVFGQGSFGTWTHITAVNTSLLFYNQNNGAGAIAKLDEQGLKTTHEYDQGSFGTWTHITAVNTSLLFYNQDSGAGAIAKLDEQGVNTIKGYDQGSFGTWTHLMTAGGYLCFYNNDNSAGTIAKLLENGQLYTVQEYPAGSLSAFTHVIEGSPIFVKTGEAGHNVITGHGLPVYKQDGAYLLFYDLRSGTGLLGKVHADNFVSIKPFEADSFGKWTSVSNHAANLAAVTASFNLVLRRVAQEKIAIEYRRRGSNHPVGLLGPSVGAIERTGIGHFVQNYQYGQIQLPVAQKSLTVTQLDLPLSQTDYVADIWLAAIKCIGTEDDGFLGVGGNGDEPYLIATVINPAPAWLGNGAGFVTQTVRTEIFEDIHENSVFAENRLLFMNLPLSPYGVQLKIALFEHESGDPEDLRRRIEEQGREVGKELVTVVGAIAGLKIDEAAAKQTLDSKIGRMVQDVTFDRLTDWLKDDMLGEKTFAIPATMLKDWFDNGKTETSDIANGDLPEHINFNFPRNFEDAFWLYSNGGGSYKVYLRVIPKKITITATPSS